MEMLNSQLGFEKLFMIAFEAKGEFFELERK